MNNIKISAVLFDLDGVLVNACDWHYEALNSALTFYKKNPINKHDHENIFNGLPTKVKLNMLGISLEEAIKINIKKQENTIDIIKTNAKIMPEKIKLLNFLKKNNIKIACVTNSIKETTETMLKTTGQFDFFDLIVTNENVIKNKPHPDCYNYAIKLLKANPLECICVEDSEKGIQAAISSIAKHIWIVKDTNDVTLENYINFTGRKL